MLATNYPADLDRLDARSSIEARKRFVSKEDNHRRCNRRRYAININSNITDMLFPFFVGCPEWFGDPNVSRGSDGSRFQALHLEHHSANDRQAR